MSLTGEGKGDELSKAGEKKKNWKNILIGCGILALIGVILIGVLTFFGYRALKSRVETNPQKVEEEAKTMMDYEITGGSRGMISMNLGFKMTVVQSITNIDDSPKIVLILASVPQSMIKEFNKSNESFEERLQKSFSKDRKMLVKESETIEKTVCGQKRSVTVKHGSVEIRGKTLPATSYHVFVNQNNKGIFALITASGENHEKDAAAVFDSLKCK